MGVMDVLGPVMVALVYISLSSLFREPNRRSFNAIFVAGAGAAYLSGGFGIWEFAFLAVVTYYAYKGLRSYSFIGAGWLLHTGWDVLHHLYGNPIVPFVPDSSLGCAICDPVIALWCFAGAPSVYDLFREKRRRRQAGGDPATQPDARPRMIGLRRDSGGSCHRYPSHGGRREDGPPRTVARRATARFGAASEATPSRAAS